MWGVLRQDRGQLSGKKSRNRVIEGKCTGVYPEGKLHKLSPVAAEFEWGTCQAWNVKEVASVLMDLGYWWEWALSARCGKWQTGKRWCSEVASTKSKHQQGSQFLSFGLHSRDSFFTPVIIVGYYWRTGLWSCLPHVFSVSMINCSLKWLVFSGEMSRGRSTW